MISSEELQVVKAQISNEDIKEDFLSSYTNSTRKNVNSMLSYFLKDNYFGYSKHFFEIENNDIEKFFTYLKLHKNLSLRTKKARFSYFKIFISHLFNKYNKYFDLEAKIDMYFKLNDNSWQSWTKSGHKKERIIIVLNQREIEKICSFLQLKDNKKYLMYRILIETGMRKSELLSIPIEREDYYTTKKTTLEEYLDMNIIITEGKTGYKEYPIPEYSELKMLLKSYLRVRRKVNTEYKQLFLSNRCKPYHKPCAWLNNYLNVNKVKMGFDSSRKIYPHLFRHTLNTHRERMNCPEDVREFLVGHAPTTSNKKYTHRDRKRKVELATKFNPYRNTKL